ncbi:hypothetical protein Vadar_006853 [Vaccinium darrowii]|uniref:Uncharacterized protein n=1 Tax=Vaccinium darrowii TaxID=229202 RepID=A0ACB7XG29_9ERIC|nr:hypothetical protein Vadar_006853 [Vaccinium darrowii]
MATMESLIGLVNRIKRACIALGDYGGGDTAFSSLWDALPSVAVVGGQGWSWGGVGRGGSRGKKGLVLYRFASVSNTCSPVKFLASSLSVRSIRVGPEHGLRAQMTSSIIPSPMEGRDGENGEVVLCFTKVAEEMREAI